MNLGLLYFASSCFILGLRTSCRRSAVMKTNQNLSVQTPNKIIIIKKMFQRRIHSSLFTQQPVYITGAPWKKVSPFSMPYFFQCYNDGLLWAVEDDSAAPLTRQLEFLQMVINEVQHGVQFSAQTALTVMPRPGDMAVFSQMCYIWSRYRHQVAPEGSSNPIIHITTYTLLTTCCCSAE